MESEVKYRIKVGDIKGGLSQKEILDKIDDEKFSIRIGNLTLPNCIGIPSSNLTQDEHAIDFLFNELGKFKAGWITVKSCQFPRELEYSTIDVSFRPNMRILHTDERIPESTLLCGEREFLPPKLAIKLCSYIKNKAKKHGYDDLKVKFSLFTRGITPNYCKKMLRRLYQIGEEKLPFDLLEIPTKYIAKDFEHLLYHRPDLWYENTHRSLIYIQQAIREALTELHDPLGSIPIIYKLSMDVPLPDLSALELAREGAHGFVIFDSEKIPVFLPLLSKDKKPVKDVMLGMGEGYIKSGGALAGKAIVKDSLKYLFMTYQLLSSKGFQPVIISSGGIDTPADFITRILLGACGGEICTSFLRRREIKRPSDIFWKIMGGLILFMENHDYDNLKELIALTHKPQNQIEEIYKPIHVSIDSSRCKFPKCALCFCWHDAIKEDQFRRLFIDDDLCLKCLNCLPLCKQGAIVANGLNI